MNHKYCFLLSLFLICSFHTTEAQIEQPGKIENDSVQSIGQIKGLKGGISQGDSSEKSRVGAENISGRTTSKKKDKTPEDSLIHSPKKATMLSSFLPGAGQYYNKKYWKIPIIYAGFGILGYSVSFNQFNYRYYKDELIRRQQGLGGLNPDLERYSNSNLDELQSFYRRNRDLSYIGIALLYVVNVIDATVDAHLFEFDMSDDLSFKWNLNQSDLIATGIFQPRLTFSFRF